MDLTRDRDRAPPTTTSGTAIAAIWLLSSNHSLCYVRTSQYQYQYSGSYLKTAVQYSS
jgi:hypothetical protein